MATQTLPTALQQQLRRLGVTIEHPSDAYAVGPPDGAIRCRFIYLVVGKLLSGPTVIIEDPNLGYMQHYRRMGTSPSDLMISVLPSRHATRPEPLLNKLAVDELLQIDLRLCVPTHPSLAHYKVVG